LFFENFFDLISQFKFISSLFLSDFKFCTNFKNFKMKKGSVAQTLLNHTDVILHNIDDNNLNLFVRRSFSEDLWLWINDSARFL